MKKRISFVCMLVIVLVISLIAVSCNRAPMDTDTETEFDQTTEQTTDAESESQEVCDHEWSDYTYDEGKHYASCVHCGQKLEEGHAPSSEYSFDDVSHWTKCGVCDAKLSVQEHSVELKTVDENTHNSVCTVCGSVESTDEHEFAVAVGKESHACPCGATESCPAISDELVHSDTEHWRSSCDVCGIEDERQEHAWIYILNTRHCDVCAYEQICTREHQAFDKDGHWIQDDCEICRITADDKRTPHSEDFRVLVYEDGEQRILDYACLDCKYAFGSTSVPSSINYYCAPGQIINNWNCNSDSNGKAEVAGTIIQEGNTSYSRITLYKGASLEFSSKTYDRGYVANEPISGGSGKYAVIRFRAHNVDTVSLMLNSDASSVANDSTIDPGKEKYRIDRAAENILEDTWQTVVIDLEKVGCENYKAGDKSVECIAFGLFFVFDEDYKNLNDGSAYIDIEYAAICDNWTEIERVVGKGQKVLYTKWSDTALDATKKTDGSALSGVCLGDCAPTLVIEGNTYTYKCSVSGCTTVMETRTVNVGADGVNYYAAAGQQYNNYHAEKMALNVDKDGGFVYNSISFDISGSVKFSNCSIVSPSETVYGGGKYFVIKVRASSSTVQMKLAAYDNTDLTIASAGAADPLFESNVRSTVNTDWTVFIIDAENMLSEALKAANQTEGKYYTVGGTAEKSAIFGYKIANGRTGTVDIAYFAVCDNWKEIDSVVGNDDVVLTDWETPSDDAVITADEIDKKAAAGE